MPIQPTPLLTYKFICIFSTYRPTSPAVSDTRHWTLESFIRWDRPQTCNFTSSASPMSSSSPVRSPDYDYDDIDGDMDVVTPTSSPTPTESVGTPEPHVDASNSASNVEPIVVYDSDDELIMVETDSEAEETSERLFSPVDSDSDETDTDY